MPELVTYVALLRGINVGGSRMVKMERLRATVVALGFADVRTYINSGNVIFRAPKQPTAALAKKLEEKIQREFGFPVPVVLRSAEEIQKAIRNNPFLQRKERDTSLLHVMFLAAQPGKTALKAIAALPPTPEEFTCHGAELYLYCPNGMGKSKLNFAALEKLLAVGATTRNWNTVNKLAAMALE